jgi:hypothetical protein
MGGGNTAHQGFGITELGIFIAAIVTGTACSICSKTMMQLHGIGVTGELELFEKPMFQTLGQFVGMTFGLFLHWMVLYFEIPFPGYEHDKTKTNLPDSFAATETSGLLAPKSSENGAQQVTSKLVGRYERSIDYLLRMELSKRSLLSINSLLPRTCPMTANFSRPICRTGLRRGCIISWRFLLYLI